LVWPEKFAIEQPTKAMAAALGTGFLLNLLPVGKIVGILTDAALLLARPLLIGVGVLKIRDYCCAESKGGEKTKSDEPGKS
jgi:hypothetical protein